MDRDHPRKHATPNSWSMRSRRKRCRLSNVTRTGRSRWPTTGGWASSGAWASARMTTLNALNATDGHVERLYEEGKIPAPPILEWDPAGNLVKAWGGRDTGIPWFYAVPPKASNQGLREHGVNVDPQGNLWVSGGNHLVLKFSPQGKFLLQLGERNKTGGSNHQTQSAARRVSGSTRRPMKCLSPTATSIVGSSCLMPPPEGTSGTGGAMASRRTIASSHTRRRPIRTTPRPAPARFLGSRTARRSRKMASCMSPIAAMPSHGYSRWTVPLSKRSPRQA